MFHGLLRAPGKRAMKRKIKSLKAWSAKLLAVGQRNCSTSQVHDCPTPCTLGLQVPSEKVFGVGLEGPNTEPEEARLEL